jgi:hypothetical protein
MSNYHEHQELLRRVKLNVQKEFPEIRIFDRHVGLFYTKFETPIKIGLKGQCDLYGFYKYVHFEMELKTGNAVLSKEQKAWRDLCLKQSVPWALIRHENEAIIFINGFKKELYL